MSHLDTQWRWTLRDTLARHLPKTLRQNFAAFAKHPGYVLSFDGAFRYDLVAEYFPREFPRLRSAVAAGRWAPVGAMLDAADVNVPSPESLVRQILYGNRTFERLFGRRCRDLFLPDCFGFGFALPTVAAHCAIVGFSSQKLSKGRSAAPIPFALGRWEGPDGSRILAALRPGGYGEPLRTDLAHDAEWTRILAALDDEVGVPVGLAYYGVGDTGGVLDGESLRRLDRALATPDGAIDVRTGPASRIFDELAAEEIERLPVHRGELLLSVHATGCYTSQAAMKRWNRLNEQLGDAAERACVAASLLTGAPYPRRRLEQAWTRFLVHQFHDDLPGTSLPTAYRLSWNDELLSLNQFADALCAGVGEVAGEMDTAVDGQPVVVFNPLAEARFDPVEIDLPGRLEPGATYEILDGETALARLGPASEGARLSFEVRLPSLGFKVLALRRSAEPHSPAPPATNRLRDDAVLENEHLRAEFDAQGDLASLIDRRTGRELLAAPVRLETLPDTSLRFPAWEILHDCIAAEPERFAAPTEIRRLGGSSTAERLAIERSHLASRFRAHYSLAPGARRLELDLEIDWASPQRLLKLRVETGLPDARALYDLGVGIIERPPNTPRQYEVPAQQWAALEAGDESAGLAILNDCKYGWDRPAPNCLRLTLLHSPRVGRRFRYQRHQDFGPHRVRIAFLPYAGSWRDASQVPAQAARFNQPPRAFFVPGRPGRLGREVSLLELTHPSIALRALKAAEDGPEIVARLQETSGRPSPGELRARGGVTIARRLTGDEMPLAQEAVSPAGHVPVELRAFEMRTLALTFGASPADATPQPRPIPLPFDFRAATHDREWRARGFDGRGRAYPAELWPATLEHPAHRFELGEATALNALRCTGQVLRLDAAAGSRILLLAAARGGDRRATFGVDGRTHRLEIPDWTAPIGAWAVTHRGRRCPPFCRRVPVEWYASHHHWFGRNQAYRFCHLFRLELVAESTARTLHLPSDPRVVLFAVTVLDGAGPSARPATPLYD